MVEHFNNGFEESDFSAWTGTVGAPAVVNTSNPHHGTYHEEVDTNNKEYCHVTFTEDQTVYVRLEFKWDGSDPGNWQNVWSFLTLLKTATNIVIIGLLRAGTGVWQIRFTTFLPGQVDQYHTFAFSVDTYYCLELYFLRNVAGAYYLYLDGVEILSRVGVDTTAVSGADVLRVGATVSRVAGTGWIDCVVVADARIYCESDVSIPVMMHHYNRIYKKIRG